MVAKQAELIERDTRDLKAFASPRGLGRITALFTRRIVTKILGPYLLLISLMALLGTFVVMRLVSGSLEERLVNQLNEAGVKVSDTMIAQEQRNLDGLRASLFTKDVSAAVQRADVDYLQKALAPIQANFELDFVDVIGRDGRPVLSLRSNRVPQEGRAIPPDLATWDVSQKVLAGREDARGDKWSQLIKAPWGGLILSTGGPVRVGNQPVGAILVGVLGERVLGDMAKNSFSQVSLYGPQGEIVATTFGVANGEAGEAIDPSLGQRILGSDRTIVQRSLQIGRRNYLELLGRLDLRGAPVAVVGIAQPTNSIANTSADTRNQMIILFSIVIVFVMIIGVSLARALTQPVAQLVQASRRVATGDLATYVEPRTADEMGILSVSFNEMVSGLRERERVKEMMGKYMTPQVAEAILSGEAKLGGERKLVTVLMSDIRGFTTLSQNLEPEALVTLLNGYFERMIEATLEFDGTIDKFIGDAILVVYGAPKFFPDHAEKACRTAVRMREYLVEYNEKIVQKGLPTLRIGIGVNTGYVVAGNIGSEARTEYTVMGDTVNTTQRVEDLCKEFRTDILISESTYELCRDAVIVSDEHEVTVRGRTVTTKIFPLVGIRDSGADAGGRMRTRVAAVR